MANINVTVANRICTVEEGCNVLCGNNDYTATFTFDSEWDDMSKYARFVWNNQYCDVRIPSEGVIYMPIITNAIEMKVGVYSRYMRTTTPAYIPCTPSILCESGFPHWM